MAKYGWHLICDAFNVKNDLLLDLTEIVEFLDHIVKLSDSTLMHREVVPFDGDGYTVVYTLSESHLSYHGWPEHGTFQLDVFTCSGNDLTRLRAHLVDALGEDNTDIQILRRTIHR